MRITGLEIDNFGVWSSLQLSELARDVTVFYGPNEAGKTTLMQFVRTGLFGFSRDRTTRYVTGPFRKTAGRIGGRLLLSTHEGTYQVARHASELDVNNVAGDLRVTTADGSRAGSYRLEGLLEGIDESVFQNVFAIGIDEIQELNTLSATQAAQHLYSLSTGADRVSLVDVMKQLRTTRTQLLGADGKPGLLSQVLSHRDRLQGKIEELGEQTRQWGDLTAQLQGFDTEVELIEARRDQLRRQVRSIEIALRVRPKWVRRQQVNTEIHALGAIRDLPDNIVSRLASADSRIQQRDLELEQLRQRRTSLAEQADQVPVREALLRQAARVEVLQDQRKWLASLDESVRRLDTQIEEAEFEFQAEQERLGFASSGSGKTTVVDAELQATLREPARAWRRAKQRLTSAKRELTKHKSDAEKLQQEIGKSLGSVVDGWTDTPKNDVNKALEKIDTMASSYRRRIELTQQLVELREQHLELDDQRTRQLANQFLPRPVLIALGILFAVGGAMNLSALFQLVADERRGWFLLIGSAMCAAAAFLKWTLDNATRSDLRNLDQRRNSLQNDIDSMVSEIESLGGHVDEGLENSQRDLQDAESRLGSVEKLMPLDRKRQEALRQAKLAEQRAIAAANELRAARGDWANSLQHHGLPVTVTPKQIRSLVGLSGTIHGVRAKVDDLKHQRELAQRELGSIQTRILALYREAAITPNSENPVQQLDQLVQIAQSQKELIAKRDQLRREERQARRDEERLEQSVIQLQRKRVSLVASAGVADESELLQVVERREAFTKLKEQREALEQELILLFGDGADTKEVEAELGRYNGDQLNERLKQLQRDATTAEQQLKERLQKRGELAQRIKTLEEDDKLAMAQLELGMAEHKLAQGLERWKVMTAITFMLKHVYKRYEKDRQPHTLTQASDFLARMTEGRYTRIWTPLAEDILLVDGKQGESLPIEIMSRGTREQVYLALRLALVADYERRGVKIPMVLDDVLVNFDVNRAKAAAQVLIEFAREGHQMLLFTCHEHISHIFHDLGAEVRNLPRSAELDTPLLVQTTDALTGVTDFSRERRKRMAALAASESRPVARNEYSAGDAVAVALVESNRAAHHDDTEEFSYEDEDEDEDDEVYAEESDALDEREVEEEEYEEVEVEEVDTAEDVGPREDEDDGDDEDEEEYEEYDDEDEEEEDEEEDAEEDEVEYEYVEVDEDDAGELGDDEEYEYEYVEVEEEDEDERRNPEADAA